MRQIFPIPHLVLQEYDSHRFLIAIMNLVDQICPYLRFGRIGMQDTNSQSASVIDRILNVLGADSRDGQVTVNFTCIAKYHLIFETVASLPGPIPKIARQEQGESTWDPLDASELPPNSANGLIPSLIAWAKSQPPGNDAIVSIFL